MSMLSLILLGACICLLACNAVSLADTKKLHREAERTLAEAEKLKALCDFELAKAKKMNRSI